MVESAFESRLREELDLAADLAADQLDRVGRFGPVAEGPEPGFRRRVERRRRRAVLVGVALPVATVLGLVGGGVVALSSGDGDDHDVVALADDPAVPTVRRVLDSAHPDITTGLAPLRRPMVTALDDGFMIWGGDLEGGSRGFGAVFRESTGAWQLVPEGPLTSRFAAATVWTGDEVVIAGGIDDTDDATIPKDAAAFDPDTGAWRSLPDLPELRANATALYAAGRIVLAGGNDPTGSSSPTVLVGGGQGAWASVDVGHPVHGGVVVGDRVVVYGMDDFAGERAPLELSAVDPVSLEVTPLPALPPAEWVTADYVGDLAVGSDGGDVVVVLGGDGDYALQRLDLEAQRWSEPLRVRYDGRFLSPERMRGTVTGVVVMAGPDGTTPWVITAHGSYAIDPDDGHVDRLGEVDERCSGHTSLDGVTTFAVGPVSTLFWVDRSCDGEIGLAGQEGAVLVSLGAGRG